MMSEDAQTLNDLSNEQIEDLLGEVSVTPGLPEADDAEQTETEATDDDQPEVDTGPEDEQDGDELPEAAEAENETGDDTGPIEPYAFDYSQDILLDYDALDESGAKVLVDGQIHDIDKVLYRWRQNQKERQAIADEKKAWESETSDIKKRADQGAYFRNRLETDATSVAIDALAIDHPGLAREFAFWLHDKVGYDARDAEIKARRAEDDRRKSETDEQATRAARDEARNKVRLAVSDKLGKEITADQWAKVEAYAPAARVEFPDLDDWDTLSKAYEMAFPKRDVIKRKPPKAERPTQAPERKKPGLAGLSNDELYNLL